MVLRIFTHHRREDDPSEDPRKTRGGCRLLWCRKQDRATCSTAGFGDPVDRRHANRLAGMRREGHSDPVRAQTYGRAARARPGIQRSGTSTQTRNCSEDNPESDDAAPGRIGAPRGPDSQTSTGQVLGQRLVVRVSGPGLCSRSEHIRIVRARERGAPCVARRSD